MKQKYENPITYPWNKKKPSQDEAQPLNLIEGYTKLLNLHLNLIGRSETKLILKCRCQLKANCE